MQSTPEAELRNVDSKRWNRKCGMTLIGRGVKPRYRCYSLEIFTTNLYQKCIKMQISSAENASNAPESVFLTVNPVHSVKKQCLYAVLLMFVTVRVRCYEEHCIATPSHLCPSFRMFVVSCHGKWRRQKDDRISLNYWLANTIIGNTMKS